MKIENTFQKEREERFWRLLEGARGDLPVDFLPVVRYLREKGEQLSIHDLMYLHQRLARFYNGWLAVPVSVAGFFSQLLRSRSCDTILDPYAGFGLLGACLADSLSARCIDIVSLLAEASEIAAPLNLRALRIHFGSMTDVADKLQEQYDAIVSIPPVNRPREKRSFPSKNGQLNVRDDPSYLLIAESAAHLSPGGLIAFVVAPGFALRIKSGSILSHLDQFGLHLSALLTFRPGAFIENDASFELAIIEGKPAEKLFVAEVPEEPQPQKELVERLRKRSEGLTTSQGRLVLRKHFFGLSVLEDKERVAELATGKGLEPVPFSRAVSDIRVPKRTGTAFTPCEDHPHAVYLPEMAKTVATTRQETLPAGLKSYLQLLVNPEVVLPEYLAELLNTPLGHALRRSVMTGTIIPRINKTLLRESTLYLAPVADQQRAGEAVSALRRLRAELSELESRVWERPRQVTSVIEAIGKINHEERFDEWVENLPFPLASILRSYHAIDHTDKDKYERLLYFFEAVAEFCAAVHLSAFKTNTKYWEQQRQRVAKVMHDQKFSLERPTFGLWRAVSELLAGSLRAMLRGNDEENAVARSMPLRILLRSRCWRPKTSLGCYSE